MTREELNVIRGYVSNIQAIKDAHNTEQLPINYGTICTITANGWKLIKELKVLEQQPWSLDDAREDFMHDVYNTLDFLPTNEEANRIIDSFDRVTKCIEQQPCENCISRQAAIEVAKQYWYKPDIAGALAELPPVQPKIKTGKWIYRNYNWYCSECGCTPKTLGYVGTAEFMKEHFKFCNHCGAKMVEL